MGRPRSAGPLLSLEIQKEFDAFQIMAARFTSATMELQKSMHKLCFTCCRKAQVVMPCPDSQRRLLPHTWSVIVKQGVQERLCFVFAQAYVELGPVQREHLLTEGILTPLVKTLERFAEHGAGREAAQPELNSLVFLLSTLIRRCA